MLTNKEWMTAMANTCIKFLLIAIFWKFLEVHFYGAAQPRIVDDIIGLILFYYITRQEEEKIMGKKRKSKPFGMNSSLADATQVMRQLPVSAMVASIEMQIDILRERGIEIHDWDNKDRTLRQIRILGGKAYFLADTEKDSDYTMG